MRVICSTCEQYFTSKWHYERHANRHNPCSPPRNRVLELEENVHNLNDEIVDLEEDVVELEEKLIEDKKDDEEFAENIRDLKAQILELNLRNQNLQKINQDVIKQNNELENRCAYLEIRNRLEMSRVNAFAMEVDSLRFENLNLTNELISIKRDLAIGYYHFPQISPLFC